MSRFKIDPFLLSALDSKSFLEEAGITTGKNSDTTRMKPLALANGHGCYTIVTPERALVSGVVGIGAVQSFQKRSSRYRHHSPHT